MNTPVWWSVLSIVCPVNPQKHHVSGIGSVVGVLVLLVFSNWSAAQSPPDAGALLQEQQRQQTQAPDVKIPERVTRHAALPVPEPNTPTVTIQRVQFSGYEGLIEEATLQTVVQEAIGREVDFTGLQHLADWVTQYLRSQDYLLAQAYLPQQDITDGQVKIAILQGHLDGEAGDLLTVNGDNLRIAERRLEAMAAATLAPDKSIRQKDLERSLLLMNDLPGVSARSMLEPGQAPGSTRMNVQVAEGPLLGGSAWVDNYGSRYSGVWRANSQVNINDPWGQGDQVRFFGTLAKDYQAGTAGYSLPLGHKGLRLSADVTTLTYKIGKELGASQLEGAATMIPARLVYPLMRSRQTNLYATGGYAWKSLEDKAAGTIYRDRNVQSGLMALSGNHRDGFAGGGFTDVYVGVVAGDLDLSGVASDLATDRSTAKADGGFTRMNYKLSRTQNLPGVFSLYGAVQGQASDKNLNSSEKISLGGPYGIRAYPVNEGRGDQGWLANLELRYNVPQAFRVGSVQLKAFYDTGRITLNHSPWSGAVNTATGRNSYSLSGAGLGATLVKSGRYHLDATWATTLGSNPGRDVNHNDADGQQDNHRFWIQGVLWF